MRHIDIVQNLWGVPEQVRVGRVTFDYPERPDLEQVMADPLVRSWDNFYLFVTELHAEDACPFSDGDRLPMEVVDATDAYTLPALSDEEGT